MLILDEKKYAENLYNCQNNDVKGARKKIEYITRYLLHSKKYDDYSNYTATMHWMSKNSGIFEESSYSKMVSDAIKMAQKRPFFKLDCIKITQKELENIKNLENLRAEKVIFVLLCMAKQQKVAYGFTDGLVKYEIAQLCKEARISVPSDDREYILYHLVQNGLLSYPKKNDSKCLIVNFIDEDGESVLNLDENKCQELVYEYLYWRNNGNGYAECELCNRMMKQSRSNPKRFCKECSEKVGDVPDNMKALQCIEQNCDVIFYVDKRNMTKCRCDECQSIRDMETKSTRNARYYKSHKN